MSSSEAEITLEQDGPEPHDWCPYKREIWAQTQRENGT